MGLKKGMMMGNILSVKTGAGVKTESKVTGRVSNKAISNAAHKTINSKKHASSDVIIPNAATISAIEEARAGKLQQSASLDALFDDLNA
ncbi:MAG: hypothetical protein AB8B77_00525 [Alphaproteobacteria bacterium]